MVFKINIASKDGKTYKMELESESFDGMKLHDKLQGNEVLPDLSGYEFEITGASDKAGFPLVESVEGIGLSSQLLSYEKGMKKRPKHEGKRTRSKNKPKGLRLRKTVRGNTLSSNVTQINLKILKEGSKKLEEVFSDQAKEKEKRQNRKLKRQKAKESPEKEQSKEKEIESSVEVK